MSNEVDLTLRTKMLERVLRQMRKGQTGMSQVLAPENKKKEQDQNSEHVLSTDKQALNPTPEYNATFVLVAVSQKAISYTVTPLCQHDAQQHLRDVIQN